MNLKIRLEDFKKSFKEKIDLFICSSSFEERCFSLPLAIKNINPKKTLTIFNNNEYQEIIDNEVIMQNIFKKKYQSLAINSAEPLKSGLLINETIRDILKANNIKNIFIDITTFTHETLLLLIKIFSFEKNTLIKIFIGYVGANDYSLDEDDIEKKWLSNGISEIRSVLGYPGTLSPAKPFHLIVLFGFESERTQKLIEDYQFDRISIGFGKKGSSIHSRFQELNCNRHKELLKLYPVAEEFDISLIDPFEARDEILAQAAKYPEHNIVIAPMNNKISTVGVALAAIKVPRIQLIYAKSINYNVNGYSTPKDECYVFEMKGIFDK